MASQPIPALDQFLDLDPLRREDTEPPRDRVPVHHQKFISFSKPSPKGPPGFYQGNCALRK